MKIKAKHNQENFTLSLPEYEEILDALVGSHYSTVPDHLAHESHHELGALLMQVRTDFSGLLSIESICQALGSDQSFIDVEACVIAPLLTIDLLECNKSPCLCLVHSVRRRQSCQTCKVPWRGRKRISITSIMWMALEMRLLSWPGYSSFAHNCSTVGSQVVLILQLAERANLQKKCTCLKVKNLKTQQQQLMNSLVDTGSGRKAEGMGAEVHGASAEAGTVSCGCVVAAKHATALRAGKQVQDAADRKRLVGSGPPADCCVCHLVVVAAHPNQGRLICCLSPVL